MKLILIIAGVVVVAVFIAWLIYNKRLQNITSIYKEIAERQGGEVETGGLSLQPRLKLWYQGTPILISHAYTGTLSAKPGYYTYAQFSQLPKTAFRFRIVPTAKLDQIDQQMMRHKMRLGIDELDEHFTASSNQPEHMQALLTPEVIKNLLEWVQASELDGIEDIHNFEDKLVFSIFGTPPDYAAYQKLLTSAKLFLDAYLAAMISPDRKKSGGGY